MPPAIRLVVYAHTPCPPPPPPSVVTIRLDNASGLCLLTGDTGANVREMFACLWIGMSMVFDLDDVSETWHVRTIAANVCVCLCQVTVGACDGDVSEWIADGTTGTIASQAHPTLCLTFATDATAVILNTCVPASALQQWTWADGSSHIESLHASCKWQYGKDTCCLDDWGGNMRAGDVIYAYSCWSGKNQQWKVVAQ